MPRVIATSTSVQGYIPQTIHTDSERSISVTEGTSSAHNVVKTDQLSAPLLFLQAALRRVRLEQLEDDNWFSEITECPGVWGGGRTQLECLRDLMQGLEEWVRLKLKDGDKDFPVLDGINLNLL